jgi:hypothetical protein
MYAKYLNTIEPFGINAIMEHSLYLVQIQSNFKYLLNNKKN